MSKRPIKTQNAPQAIGPYSQGMIVGETLYISGQLPMTPDGTLVDNDAKAAATQALDNVRAVVEAGGFALKDVVKATIFLRDMGDFPAVNEVYAKYFVDPAPARACIEVAALPRGARLEIEAIAIREGRGGTG